MNTENHPYVCPFEDCAKSFKARKSLVEHLRIHKGEKPYQCHFPNCGKRFTQYSSMQKHERTHTGDKPYRCNTCGRDFTQISNLKRHERVHAGEKPHECQFCQKKFSTASNLKQHMHIHEKGDIREKHFCEVCGKMYLYRSSLRKHLQEHEAGLINPDMPYSMKAEEEYPEEGEEEIYNESTYSPAGVEFPYTQNAFSSEDNSSPNTKREPSSEEPALGKYVFVDQEERIPNNAPQYYMPQEDFAKPLFEEPKGLPDLMFPDSPSYYLSKAFECEKESKLLPLTPLLGSPIRASCKGGSKFSFSKGPSTKQTSKSVIMYKGETYFLYDRMLNRYKPNGELEMIQIANDETNPNHCHHMPEISHYPDYDSLVNAYKQLAQKYSKCLTLEMLMSEKNCNSLVCNCRIGAKDGSQKCKCDLCVEARQRSEIEHAHCHHQSHRKIDEVEDDECPLEDNFCQNLKEQKERTNGEHVCLCSVTKDFRHTHGPNCGHLAIMHDGHLDYIVDGVLHHQDGDHCDNHGPICLVQGASEDYAMGLISYGYSNQIADCRGKDFLFPDFLF